MVDSGAHRLSPTPSAAPDQASRADVELSIVIPTRGRPRRLRACIESLVEQTELPEGLELIVVVDGPDPVTEQMLSSLEPPFPLQVVVQEHARQAAARNRGVEEARGRYVLFLDDDIVAGERLVAAHLEVLRAGDRIVGIGRIEKVLSRRAPRWARTRQTVWRNHYERLAAGRAPRFTDCYGGNLSLSRSAFMAVGGFAVDLTVEHDVEFGYRLGEAGMTFVHVRDAVAREEDRDTLRRFVADARRRGMVGVMLYERHPALLPYLRLGGAGELPRQWIALRRLLLVLRLPPRLLAVVAKLAPSDAFVGRWLSFLYSYCYSCGVRDNVDGETWRRLQRGTAILMYHAVGRERESPSRYVLPVSRFKRQLAWLKLRRYSVISLDEFVRARIEHRLPPPRSVVLTFDDGYADNVELGLPALERYGFPATIFLVSAAEERANWDSAAEVQGRPLLTPVDARGLNGRLAFGAHSRTHPRLPRLEPAELEREVSGSRIELEAALGAPVSTFAYPYGETSPDVEQAVVKAGYLAACGISPGRNRPAGDLYALHRLEVRGTDSLLRFGVTLWLGDTRSFFGRRRRDS
jgi:peptidoglycan/xylan/chitin deacetylase (PgdA/CDA1 family)/glycosyltransferase involved in cell wall biosynthesis